MNPVKALRPPDRRGQQPTKSSWRRGLLGPVMACLALAACGPAEEQDPRPEQSLTEQRAEVTSAPAEPLSADLSGDIARVLVDTKPVVMGDADFFDNQDTNLMVQQNNTEVFITFVSSTALNNNTLLYFTYPNGQEPTSAPTLSQSNVVFGALSGLASGTTVKLGTFNAGIRIGYAVVANGGATNPPDLSRPKVYSVAGLNSGKVQILSKYHKAESRRVIGVEDTDLATADKDYNDAVFLIRSSPPEVITDVTTLPAPISTLTTYHRGCTAAAMNGTTGVTRDCYSAGEFYCRAQPGEFSGANIIAWDSSANSATIECYRSKYYSKVDIAEITSLESTCTQANIFANGSTQYPKTCQLGADKYCNNKGHAAGLIQQSDTINNVFRVGIACYDRAYKGINMVNDGAWASSDCLSTNKQSTAYDFPRICRSNASKYCKDNVTGAKGGILSGMTGTQAKITCL